MVKFLPSKLLCFLFAFLVISGSTSSAFANISQGVRTGAGYEFPVYPGLEKQVNFWKKIYSEYTTDYAVLHDSKRLDIVYEVVYLGGKSLSRRGRDRKLKKVKKKYITILRNLARKKNKSILTGEEKRIHGMVKNGFYQASRNIRSQIGQKDRFERGIYRSGRYMSQIKKIFKDYDLPQELSALPHVESSFHEGAYSSAGAAGIWQFTRGTGRLFMRVHYDVDERRDPILSTHGAAKLLKSNYERLKSWPLAITAYNHGTRGMERAKKKYGDNIVTIIENYKSRTFGFASKNFYAEFLAALYVASNEKKYFPSVVKANPIKQISFRFDDYVHISSVMKYFGMEKDEIARFNPALRNPVITGQKRIPRGYIFKAPAEKFNNLEPFYQKIAAGEKFNRQIRSKWYTVQRGDTLSGLALRFGTSVRQLKLRNNIGRRNKIYVGKVLRLPDTKARKGYFRMAKAKPKAPRTGKNYSKGSYIVRKRDNLTKIAKLFNTNSSELARLNGIRNPNSLYPGQKLTVPDGIASTLPKQTPAVTAIPQTPPSTKPEVQVAAKESRVSDKPGVLGKNFDKLDKVIESKSPDAPKIKIQLASLTPTEFRPNTNRPAYLPVTFKSEANKQSRMGEITIDFDETLSHYAEWAQTSIRRLKKANNIRRKSRIPVNTKIKVPFTNTDPGKFMERRQEFHKAIQDDFFSNYKVTKLVVRKVKKGETLWEICNDMNFIPFWLLNSYNPDKDINHLSLNEPIVIPIITPIKTKDS